MLDGDTKENRAKRCVKYIEIAVESYRLQHDRLPGTLNVLTQRDKSDNSPALLIEKALIDPWGKPYNYDSVQLHKKTGMPLIWSDGWPGVDRPIKNWD